MAVGRRWWRRTYIVPRNVIVMRFGALLAPAEAGALWRRLWRFVGVIGWRGR